MIPESGAWHSCPYFLGLFERFQDTGARAARAFKTVRAVRAARAPPARCARPTWQVRSVRRSAVLLLRGADSDLVLADVAGRMRARGPGARGMLQVVEVPDCGHAPALNVPTQLEWVEHFITQAAISPKPSLAPA